MKPKKLYPFKPDYTVPPGETLRECMLEDGRMTINALSQRIGISHRRLSRLLAGKTALTAEIAVVLGELWASAEFWMKRETTHRLFLARKKAKKR